MHNYIRLIVLGAAVLSGLAGIWLTAVGFGWLGERQNTGSVPFAGPVLLLMAAFLLLLNWALVRNQNKAE